jgi:hypothetical protein
VSRRLAEAVAAEGIAALLERLAMALCRYEVPLLRCEECKRLGLACYRRNEARARAVINEMLKQPL